MTIRHAPSAVLGIVLSLSTCIPSKSDETATPNSIIQEVYKLKHQANVNEQKIKELEARLNCKKAKGENIQESLHNWPPKYMELPNTHSAVQLLFNPNLAMTYDIDAFSADFLAPQLLPLYGVDGSAARSGRFNAQARATQFGFRTLSHTNLVGDINTELSLDFYGAPIDANGIPAYQPRLRFAFVEFSGFTFGQTTTNFLDLDAIGETVDYGTILAGSFRHGLVKYALNFNKKVTLSIAAERPVTDYTDSAGNLTNAASASSMPDLTAHLKYQDSFGHISFRGVLRDLKIKDNSSLGQPFVSNSFHKAGWGLGLSGKFFIYQKSNIFGQINFGNGIGRYIILCNGESALYNATRRVFDLQKASNFIVGLEHLWSDILRSNIIFARTKINVSKFLPILTGTTRVTKSMNQFILNLIYSPLPMFDFGIEYGYADRKTADLKFGKANRITVGALYKF